MAEEKKKGKSIFDLEGSVYEEKHERSYISPTGVDMHGETESKFITGSTSGSLSSGIKRKDGKINDISLIDGSFKGNGDVYSGHIGGNYGALSGEGNVEVGNIEGSISGKIKLVEEGKFAPQIQLGGHGEVNAVKGNFKGQLGDENNNAHVKATGEMGHAEVNAGVGAGKITYKDEDGNVQTDYGMYAEVGAEAYLAKGSISGGLTIFGIKFDAELEGKAGGAGANGHAKVDTGGMSGGLSLGFLLGLGINVSVDWTGAKIPGLYDKNAIRRIDLYVYPEKLLTSVQELQDISNEIDRQIARIDTIKNSLEIKGSSSSYIKKKLKDKTDDLAKRKTEIRKMAEVLEKLSKLYQSAENDIITAET